VSQKTLMQSDFSYIGIFFNSKHHYYTIYDEN